MRFLVFDFGVYPFRPRISEIRPASSARGDQLSEVLPPKIEYKKPHFSHKMYQHCGFLQCTRRCSRRASTCAP
eukprot:3211008-Rhodomonas_salina.1